MFNAQEKGAKMKYRVTQYRKLVAYVEAQDQESAEELAIDLADEDFTVEDWNEEVEVQE